MANVASVRSFFPLRINDYVPAMRYASDVNFNAGTRVDFGAPALSVATNILNAQTMAAAITVDLTSIATQIADAPFGRNVTIIASGATVLTAIMYGWDYLGQPMSETITFAGAVSVAGLKAFKTLRQISLPLVAATTANIGWGPRLGLPYKAVRCQYETVNQALAAAGTLAAPILTDPQTATTGDPRGTYTTTTALDGTSQLTAVFDMQNDVNVNGRGGLYGIAHFSA